MKNTYYFPIKRYTIIFVSVINDALRFLKDRKSDGQRMQVR